MVAAQQIDFEDDIKPVLESRCIACHGDDRTEGDLRFDLDRAAVTRGGHTGNPILGTSSADSELFRRITSDKAGYKMPKQGASLSDAEVATFKQWLDEGAPWGASTIADADVARKENQADSAVDRAGQSLAAFYTRLEDPTFARLFYLALVVGLVAIFSSVWRLKKWRSSPAVDSHPRSADWGVKNFLIGGLVALTLATWIYYDGKVKTKEAELKTIQQKLIGYTGDPNRDQLEPPYPMHPKRLGGVYYRGNDERDPKLFNGGFYRTARLDVWLVDAEGTHLAWGDDAPEEMFVQFEIHRAQNATGELFTDHVMSLIELSEHAGPSSSANGQSAVMQSVESGEAWQARLPIGPKVTGESGDKAYAGRLYVMQRTSKPKPHYGIVFDVKITDGKIDPQSELWMGSLYDLNGRVVIPHDGHVLLDRWFDWRPIPEIEGENTTDRALLGLPEHVGE